MASIHPDGMAGCGGCGEGGREQQCHVHTRPSGHAPVGRSPAVSAGDNTLHTGVGGRREATPRMGLEESRRQSKRRSLFPGWTSAVDVGAATFTHGQCMARSNLNHAKWQGRGEGERSDHQQHALQVVFYVMLRYCGPLPPSAAEWVPALGLPAGLLGGTRGWCVIVGSREECWKGGGLGAGRILALRRS